MINDVLRDAEAKMKKSVDSLRHHLTTIRTGRASPALVEQLQVEAYGSAMPLNQLAGITTPDSKSILIQPYDTSQLKTIEKAIQNSELGINPSNDGRVIRLVLPPLTEERRRDLIKVVRHEAENARVAVRNVRRDAIEHLKKLLKEHKVSEDDERRAQDEVQKLTDRFVAEIDKILHAKEADLMAV